MIDGVIAVTGRTGQGKGLCSVGLARDYLAAGRLVVTNMDLFPENMKDKRNKNLRLIRLPDIITIESLQQLEIGGCIGPGNERPEYGDENGLLLLDEVGVFLNSQDWNKPHIKPVIDWFRHRRKHGWDIAFQIQDIESINAQLRRAVIDYEMRAIKVVSIPYVAGLYRFFFKKRFKLPLTWRYHKSKMVNLETGIVEDSFRYQAQDIYPLYNTRQVISEDYQHGTHCMLTPWHLVGRYLPRRKNIFQLFVSFFLYVSLLLASSFDAQSKKILADLRK